MTSHAICTYKSKTNLVIIIKSSGVGNILVVFNCYGII